jgi:hypothetical protein
MDRLLADEWGKGLLLEIVFLEGVTVIILRLDLAAAIRVGRILPEAEELEFALAMVFRSSVRIKDGQKCLTVSPYTAHVNTT